MKLLDRNFINSKYMSFAKEADEVPPNTTSAKAKEALARKQRSRVQYPHLRTKNGVCDYQTISNNCTLQMWQRRLRFMRPMLEVQVSSYKRGMKFWCLADNNKIGYVQRFYVYQGQIGANRETGLGATDVKQTLLITNVHTFVVGHTSIPFPSKHLCKGSLLCSVQH